MKALCFVATILAVAAATDTPDINPNRIEYAESVTIGQLSTLSDDDVQNICLLKWRLGICTKNCKRDDAKTNEEDADEDDTKTKKAPVCKFCERKFPQFYCLPGYILPPKMPGLPCSPGDEHPRCKPRVLPPHQPLQPM